MTQELPPSTLDDLLDRLHRLAASIGSGEVRHELAELCHELAEEVDRRLTAERELRTRGNRYRTLFRNAAEGMFRSDIDGRVIEANPAMARMLACPNPEAVLRLNMARDIYARPQDRDAILAELLADGTLHAREILARRQSGETFWVSVSAAMVTDGEGKPRYIDAIAEDITARRQAEDRLRESERRYRLLVETSHDLIWSVDSQGLITFANREAVKRLLGMELEEVVGRHFASFMTEDTRDTAQRAFAKLAAGEAGHRFEVDALSASARRIRLEIKSAAHRDDDGTFLGASGTARDLTEERRLQAQLSQAQKMQAIGQLAGGMAHDFNNQLAGIGGFSELLLQELEPDTTPHHQASRINALARRGSALTRKLLTFARQDSEPEQPVDLHEVIEEVVPLLELGGGHDIEIRRRFEADESVVMGDRGLLANAVLNLLVNARDAMATGGAITITSAVTRPDHAHNSSGTFALDLARTHLELRICDTGCGMDEAVRERIFEPFFTTKDPGVGTGIGLSTVFGTVRSHGGAITVESAPGEGTCFSILLPLAEAAKAARRESSGTRPIVASGEGEVLVAEDEEALRSLLDQALTRFGYTATTCPDGFEAVERFVREPLRWKLVILDLAMPRLDGESALARIHQRRPDVPVLMISGNIPNHIAARLTTDPSVAVLRKPFSLTQLTAAVDELLAPPGIG